MALSRRSKTRNNSTIKRKNLLDLLRKVNLGGIINECVLNVDNGIGKICAVDITNSLIVIIETRVMSKKTECKLGLGNIDLLIKFLNALNDDSLEFEVKESRLEINNPNKSRKLNYLLSQPDLVSTNLDSKDDPKKKILKMAELTTNLTDTFIKDFLTYLGIVDDKTIKLKFDGDNEQLVFLCGKSHEHQFELLLNHDIDSDGEEDFEVSINGEHFARVLTAIDFDEDEPPILNFAKDVPVVIENDNAFWALSAITDEEGE